MPRAALVVKVPNLAASGEWRPRSSKRELTARCSKTVALGGACGLLSPRPYTNCTCTSTLPHGPHRHRWQRSYLPASLRAPRAQGRRYSAVRLEGSNARRSTLATLLVATSRAPNEWRRLPLGLRRRQRGYLPARTLPRREAQADATGRASLFERGRRPTGQAACRAPRGHLTRSTRR